MPDGDTEADWREQGESLLKRDHCAEALDFYTHILEDHPDDPAAWVGKARALIRLNRYDEALVAANQALALDPEYAEGYRARGNCFYWLKRYDESLVALDRALELTAPENPDYLIYSKGRTLRNLDRNEDALACFDAVLAHEPDNRYAAAQRALILHNLKRYKEALAAYDVALALAPADDPNKLNYWKGRALHSLKRYDEALACFERATDLAADKFDPWYWKAATLFSLARYSDALDAYDHALALDPDDAKTWYWKGMTFRRLNRDGEALTCYEKAVELAPGSPDAASERASALYRLERYEDAVGAYDAALALAPANDPRGMNYWKARTLQQLNRNEEALAAFDKAVALDANQARYWIDRAVSCHNLRRYDEALANAEHAIVLNENNGYGWKCKGSALMGLERNEDAVAAFECALQHIPDDSETWFFKATCLYRLDRFDEALSAYETALALAPADNLHDVNYWKARTLQRLNRDEEALAAFDKAMSLHEDKAQWWVDRSIACHNLKRYEEALANADKAIALGEGNGYGWKLKGYALTGLGRNVDALAAFERAIELIPGDSQTWSNKGNCLNRLGRFDEGLAAYEEAVRLNPDDAGLRKNYNWAVSNTRRTTTDQRLRLRDGRWLGYLDYGDPDGAPIIYCHGTPDSRLAYFADDDLLKELHLHVIVPDRPGYGLSDFQPHRRLLGWPADVGQLADHLGIERFAVLGGSGGGPHAAACAYAIPQRLTRVGLVSSVTPPELTPLSAYMPLQRISNVIARYFPQPLLRAICYRTLWSARANPSRWAHFTSIQVSARAGESLKSLVSRVGLSAPPPLPPVAREQILEPFRQGVRGYAQDVWIGAHPWGFRPSEIHGVEVYLWHGELDPIVPVSAARALAAAIPGCHATFYADESHSLNNHLREILTSMISGAESEQGGKNTDDSPQV